MKAKFLIAAAMLGLLGATCAAADEIDNDQQAGTVARKCAQLTKGSTGYRQDQRECVAVVSGFIGGWNAGTFRGLRSAYALDPTNLASTQGIADLERRIGAIRPDTQCIAQSGMTLTAFIERFVAYTVARPERSKDIFYEVMADMVEDTVCGRKK